MLVAVKIGKMIPGKIDALFHPFPDSHTGHYNNELLETIFSLKFKDGAQIDIGLAGAGLHLHGKMHACQFF